VPAVSFASILSEQMKQGEEIRKASVKKSFARIQMEETGKRELEMYYKVLTEDTGERFEIRQLLVE